MTRTLPIDCVPVEYVRGIINDDERAFGDYSDGRFAWKLADPRPFEYPIPMRGALGLWTCTAVLEQRTGG